MSCPTSTPSVLLLRLAGGAAGGASSVLTVPGQTIYCMNVLKQTLCFFLSNTVIHENKFSTSIFFSLYNFLRHVV